MPSPSIRNRSQKRMSDSHPGYEDHAQTAEIGWVDRWSRLLDAQFRIPMTPIRFGMDVILGLIPGLGDFFSLILSGALVMEMVRRGAGIGLAMRMLANIAVDAVLGTVPVVGDLFDLFFKANLRNARLMRQHLENRPVQVARATSRDRRWMTLLLVWLVIAAIATAVLLAWWCLAESLFGQDGLFGNL